MLIFSEIHLLVSAGIKCTGLDKCHVLNGKYVQETYYPEQTSSNAAKCSIIEGLAERLSTEIFGKGRTFRDTEQCRDLVMQYLCLTYGSNNFMYSDYCIYQEDTSPTDPDNHKYAAYPPCRSFCVQVLRHCATSRDTVSLCKDM